MPSFASIIGIAAITIAFSTSAAAGANADRTWVSHSGTSGNASLNPPCTPTNPCNSFALALSVTTPGGEINCLDNGNYGAGPVFITQSVTIDCGGQLGGIGISSLASTAFIINGNIIVKLRNLTIAGQGGSNAGISVQNAAAIIIENCVIQNFNGANGTGISVENTSALQLNVSDTLIASNTDGLNNSGILILPTASAPTTFAFDRIHVENNASNGIMVINNGTGSLTGAIRDSVSQAARTPASLPTRTTARPQSR